MEVKSVRSTCMFIGFVAHNDKYIDSHWVYMIVLSHEKAIKCVCN